MPSRRDQIEMVADERRVYFSTGIRLIVVSNGPGGYPRPMLMNYMDDDDRFILLATFRKNQKFRNFERDPSSIADRVRPPMRTCARVLAYAQAKIVVDPGSYSNDRHGG